MLKSYYFKVSLAIFFTGMATAVFSQNIGINTTGTSPSANAILDLNTGNNYSLGIIIPHVELGASLLTFSPPMANAPTLLDTAMMVYNMSSVHQPIGFYYWGGVATGWVSLAGGGGGSVTGANDGTSLNGTTVILGGAFGATSGKLLQNTEIPFNGFNLTFSGTTGKFGIDLAANTSAAQALEIGQTTNSIRVNGLKSAATFNATPSAATTYMLYANTNGDIYSMPAGATGNSMIWTATGPVWSSLPAGAITASNGLTMSTATNVILGGTLTGATNIAQAGFALTITGGAINLNNATAFATAIGNGTNALTENGNVTVNANNAAATTGIGTGTTTGAITVGGAGNTIFFPKFNATGELVYTSAATGALAALPDVAIGSVLISKGVGVAPAWGAVPALANNLTAGTGIIAFTYNGSSAQTVTIANTTVVPGSYGSATQTSTFTVNAQGQLTAAASVPITGLATLNGGPTGSVLSNSAANTPAWNLSPPTAGQLLLSNNLGVPTWLTTPANGILYSNGGTPAWSVLGGLPATAGILPIANGGTNTNAIPTQGGVAYGTGTAYAFNAAGAPGDFLMSNGTSAPTWASIIGSFTIVSANNGLSWVNPNVELGGNPLIMNTSIPLAGYILDISDNTAGNGIINLNDLATGAGDAVNIGSTSSIINVNQYGTINLNVNNAAFTTNIGTGTTTGNVLIGGASNLVGVNEATPVSTLDNNGSYGVGITDIAPAASSNTILTSAYSTIIATPSAAATTYTLALPSALTNPRRIYTVIYNGSGLGTIDITSPSGGNVILSGAAISPLAFTAGSVTLQSDGVNWNAVGTPQNIGQQVITAQSTGSLTNPAVITTIPGMTSTFTITSSEYALVNFECGMGNNTGAGSTASIGVFYVYVDGAQTYVSNCMVLNAPAVGLFGATSGTWGQLLAAGTHTISIQALDFFNGCVFGAASGSTYQGTMTISLTHP